MDVLGFDDIRYEVKGQNQEMRSCAFAKNRTFLKISVLVCALQELKVLIFVNKVKVDLRGQV